VIWRNGQIQQVLPPLGGSVGVVNAINDNGQAVGIAGCVTGNLYAVLWQNGTPIDLGNLGSPVFSLAIAINNRGQIIGQSALKDSTFRAFLWQDGVMTDLGSLPGLPTAQPDGINNQGQVVGFSEDANGDNSSSVAWIWQNGVLTDLNTLIPHNSPWFLMEASTIAARS
jgi:probable HAF family extracellular repeat protein